MTQATRIPEPFWEFRKLHFLQLPLIHSYPATSIDTMSLLPSLRASSSRLPFTPLPSLRRSFHVSPPSSAVDIGTTVQSVDKALADMQRASAQMKKSGRNLDLAAMNTPVIGGSAQEDQRRLKSWYRVERTVEPPFKFSWLFRSKGRSYASQRFVRFRTTRKL